MVGLVPYGLLLLFEAVDAVAVGNKFVAELVLVADDVDDISSHRRPHLAPRLKGLWYATVCEWLHADRLIVRRRPLRTACRRIISSDRQMCATTEQASV